jgi:iron complex outermembrane receptor protein
LVPDQASEQVTQEFNLSGDAWDGKFNWLVGAFYSADNGRGAQLSVRQPATSTATNAANLFAPTIQAFEGFDLDISTQALFTQNDIKFSDVVSVTLGARYTEERMKQLNGAWIYNPNFEHAGTPLSGPGQNYQCLTGPFVGAPGAPDYQIGRQSCGIPQSVKYSGTSYLASLNLQFTPEILTYFRIARGFKGGALQWRAPTFPAVSPETAEDYEIGFKGDFFDRRLRTNLAIFQTNFSNQQLSTIVFLPGTNVRTTVLQNAADARIRGAELEFRVIPPVEGLSIYGNVGYVDAAYVNFAGALVTSGAVRDRSGEPFDIPEWTGNLGARYEMDLGPGRLGLQADAAYTGKRPLTATTQATIINVIPNLTERAAVRETLLEHREARTLVNARAEYTMEDLGLTVSVWATNLFDKEYQIPNIDLTANFGLLGGITQEPRMYGLTVRKTFGAE